MSGSTLSDIGDLIDTLSQLLSPEFLDDIHTVVTQLALLLGGDTAKQGKDLIGTASGLLTQSLIDELGSILTAAGILLTPDIANQLKSLVTDVAPVSLTAAPPQRMRATNMDSRSFTLSLNSSVRC
jgi:hypothetical protein